MVQERRDAILKLLGENKSVKVPQLLSLFAVSAETIRRDLEYLEEMGFLTRVYGGAVIKSMYAKEPEYAFREVKHYSEKLAIGKKAAELVEDGDTIVIDVGTTTLEFAKAISGKKGLTVITNSMPIAMVLSENPKNRVLFLGGFVRVGEYSTAGSYAEQMLSLFNIDKAFIGIGGITTSGFVCDYHMEEAVLRRCMIASSEMVVGLADFSKFGVTAVNVICSLRTLDYLVTDQFAPQKNIIELRNLGVKVLMGE